MSDTAVGISFYVASICVASVGLGFFSLSFYYFYHIFNSAEESGLLRMSLVCVYV